MRGERLYAPEVIDLEVACALRRLVRAGSLDERAGAKTLAGLMAVKIDRMPHAPLMSRVWELRDNLTAYDAVYVALAESLGASLLTLDGKLAGAPGIRCVVELIR